MDLLNKQCITLLDSHNKPLHLFSNKYNIHVPIFYENENEHNIPDKPPPLERSVSTQHIEAALDKLIQEDRDRVVVYTMYYPNNKGEHVLDKIKDKKHTYKLSYQIKPYTIWSILRRKINSIF